MLLAAIPEAELHVSTDSSEHVFLYYLKNVCFKLLLLFDLLPIKHAYKLSSCHGLNVK